MELNLGMSDQDYETSLMVCYSIHLHAGYKGVISSRELVGLGWGGLWPLLASVITQEDLGQRGNTSMCFASVLPPNAGGGREAFTHSAVLELQNFLKLL